MIRSLFVAQELLHTKVILLVHHTGARFAPLSSASHCKAKQQAIHSHLVRGGGADCVRGPGLQATLVFSLLL